MPRVRSDQRPVIPPLPFTRTDFYREEFIKHRQCLRRQRESYSAQALTDAEAALNRVLARLDQLCTHEDVDQVVSVLLRKFDVLTGLSGWTDPTKTH